METTVIFGGGGHIASYITRRLRQSKKDVLPVVKNQAQQLAMQCPVEVADVGRPGEIQHVFENAGGVKGIVYAVGRCRPGTFEEVNARPLNEMSGSHLMPDFDRLVIGLQNVIAAAVNYGLEQNGVIVVLGSAIVRMTPGTCPPWLHAGAYAAAQAAQAELLKWWRMNAAVRMRQVVIHRLVLGAVDGPFFDGSPKKPPLLLEPDRVARAVCNLLESRHFHRDVQMVAGEEAPLIQTPLR